MLGVGKSLWRVICKWLVSGFIGVWSSVGVVTVLTVNGGENVGSVEKV